MSLFVNASVRESVWVCVLVCMGLSVCMCLCVNASVYHSACVCLLVRMCLCVSLYARFSARAKMCRGNVPFASSPVVIPVTSLVSHTLRDSDSVMLPHSLTRKPGRTTSIKNYFYRSTSTARVANSLMFLHSIIPSLACTCPRQHMRALTCLPCMCHLTLHLQKGELLL